MKSNLVRLLAVGSLVVGGNVMSVRSASAVQISLTPGDFLNIATYGALFTGEEFTIPLGPFAGTYNSDGAVITKVEYDDLSSGFSTDYKSPGTFARADINSTNISEILSSYTTSIGVAKVKSVDLANFAWFSPTTSGGPDLSFPVNNTFDVLPAFGNFIEIDDPALGDAETPDLAIRLLNITTTQSASLLNTDAEIGVGFTGNVEYLTFGPDGQESVLGTGSFSSTLPTNGTNSTEGTSVFSFTVKPVPESSPVSGLIGFGLVGSVFALRRKASLN